MKKTLAAVAVLGAFAGSALAADVTLYGLVDEGFNYAHVDMDTNNSADDKDVFQMKSGQQSASRFGLKGVEDLGNGLKVGFVLENGFAADTGADTAPFFDRESSLFLEGGFGKVAVGRIGSFNQGQGTWSQIGRLSPFGSFGDYAAQAGNAFSCSTRYDNTIAYQTPDFAGFKVYAMYSMGSDKYENESGSDRYYGVAATYDNGPVAAYFAVDSINYKSTDVVHGQDMEDGLTVTLGGSYNFEVAKVYLGAQYFDEAKVGTVGGIIDADTVDAVREARLTGYGVLLGADAPVAGGKLMGAVAYMDAEQSDFQKDFSNAEYDFTRWIVSVGYDYPLSKRTNVYGVMSYMNDKVEVKGAQDWNPQAYTAMIGLRHKF